ncbi:MAG: helix-turn-helix transcriptional regulator [Candidatus Nanoarchaeia archaeon]
MLCLCILPVKADYYADVNIKVDEQGVVSIDGVTNHPLLDVKVSDEFTSKEGKYWILNITTEEEFSNFIYRLTLPQDSNINYIKTPGLSRFEHTPQGLRIIGTGENRPFSVVVQYSIDYGQKALSWLFFIIPLIIAFAGFGIYKYFLYKKKYKLDVTLTPRQTEIYNVVKKNKNPVTQRTIEKATGFPKASVSRNIQALVNKGVLKKEVQGMSNLITIVPRDSGMFRKK